jgi:hypothetical protein
MSSFPLTNSIIFQDGDCTHHQAVFAATVKTETSEEKGELGGIPGLPSTNIA